MTLTTVRVDITMRGAWEVALSDPDERVTCGTLAEASRVAYARAADRGPSEVIVCDAYHRVVNHQLIDARGGRRRAPLPPSEAIPSRPESRLRRPAGQKKSSRR